MIYLRFLLSLFLKVFKVLTLLIGLLYWIFNFGVQNLVVSKEFIRDIFYKLQIFCYLNLKIKFIQSELWSHSLKFSLEPYFCLLEIIFEKWFFIYLLALRSSFRQHKFYIPIWKRAFAWLINFRVHQAFIEVLGILN